MKNISKILILTLLMQFSVKATEPVFSNLFNRYLDGPTLGQDELLYFSSGSKIFNINKDKEVSLLLDFSKLNLFVKTPKIAGMTKNQSGDLLLADYKNQTIWNVPFMSGKYRTDQLFSYVADSEMKQPNDIDLFSTKYLVAADHSKGERKAGFWIYNSKEITDKYFFKTGGKLTGVTVNDNNVIVSSAFPCYVASYKINIGNKAILNWKKKCTKDWSVDGMEIKNEKIYLTRIELGRIDVLSSIDGELISGYCLLREKYFGKINEKYTFNSSPIVCRVSSEYEFGKNPTDLTFIDDKTLAVSFIGNKLVVSSKDKGYIDFIKIID